MYDGPVSTWFTLSIQTSQYIHIKIIRNSIIVRCKCYKYYMMDASWELAILKSCSMNARRRLWKIWYFLIDEYGAQRFLILIAFIWKKITYPNRIRTYDSVFRTSTSIKANGIRLMEMVFLMMHLRGSDGFSAPLLVRGLIKFWTNLSLSQWSCNLIIILQDTECLCIQLQIHLHMILLMQRDNALSGKAS